VEHSLGDGLSWTLLRCNSGGQQLCSIQKIARVVECNTKLAVALNLIEECFIQMVDTRTGIDMIRHVLYNHGQVSCLLFWFSSLFNYQLFHIVSRVLNPLTAGPRLRSS
jgi:hypothetical protein